MSYRQPYLMYDHFQILERLRNKKVLEKACLYLYKGSRSLHFYDPIERDNYLTLQEEWVEELSQELNCIENYSPRYSFAFYPPKNELCNRRMLCLHPKDHILRNAFVIVFAEIMDIDLQDSCYANRRANGDYATENLLEDFASESWPRFCAWQENCAGNLL